MGEVTDTLCKLACPNCIVSPAFTSIGVCESGMDIYFTIRNCMSNGADVWNGVMSYHEGYTTSQSKHFNLSLLFSCINRTMYALVSANVPTLWQMPPVLR